MGTARNLTLGNLDCHGDYKYLEERGAHSGNGFSILNAIDVLKVNFGTFGIITVMFLWGFGLMKCNTKSLCWMNLRFKDIYLIFRTFSVKVCVFAFQSSITCLKHLHFIFSTYTIKKSSYNYFRSTQCWVWHLTRTESVWWNILLVLTVGTGIIQYIIHYTIYITYNTDIQFIHTVATHVTHTQSIHPFQNIHKIRSFCYCRGTLTQINQLK